MKTFNLIAMAMFTIYLVVCFVAGFYNPIHFVFSAASMILLIIAFMEYRQTKKKDK